ncbi:uncharacterized protein LOC115964833 [Quercus lobata]|uniref:uncharacterized protein LOC115964833 n=1 Tax=Quercus lobata TaxID=97700 RepID=UPI0012454A1B|nr:uncharacterized protein LOC115964833 [Quercus lobata]
MYNEIDGNFDDVTISTFKSGLPTEHGLRKSLTRKPVTSLRQLMNRIDKYKRVEEDQQLSKGKGKAIPQERRDFRSDRYSNNRPRRDFTGQSGSANTQTVNALVREGKLKQLLHHFSGQAEQTGLDPQRDASSRPSLGTINVIFAAFGRIDSCPSRVMFVAQLSTEDNNSEPKRARIKIPPVLGYSNVNKIGTIQFHDDALEVTLKIGEYDVKKLSVDQGSVVEIMYPDL